MAILSQTRPPGMAAVTAYTVPKGFKTVVRGYKIVNNQGSAVLYQIHLVKANDTATITNLAYYGIMPISSDRIIDLFGGDELSDEGDFIVVQTPAKANSVAFTIMGTEYPTNR